VLNIDAFNSKFLIRSSIIKNDFFIFIFLYHSLKIKSSYKNGKIYLIKFKNKDRHIYIGSTIKNLNNRFSNHKSSHLFKRNSTSITKYIKDKYNNDWSKCYIELLMNYPCNNRKELEKKEFEILKKFIKNKKFIIINKNGIKK